MNRARTSIAIWRLNKELRLETDIPKRTPLMPVGAVLVEQHDEWIIEARYLSLDLTQQPRAAGIGTGLAVSA